MSPEPSAQDTLTLHEGDLVAGKYRVERILGRGNMGVVVAALHEQLDERVAIKILLSDAGDKTEIASRFLREARAAVKIKNPHVARVFDVGTLDDNRPYIVMEHLHGKDLCAVLAERGPLPEAEAIDYVLQACEALAEAHALGIVHRDLKPSNLFLVEEPDGRILLKVLDFGISKTTGLALAGSSDVALTAPAAIMGSPLYMSPEQIRSAKDVDVRTDVWALGVILFELLTNKTPFDADSTLALLAVISADAPQPLRRYRPDADAQIESIIARCLEKDVNKRIPSILELARALSPLGPAGAMAAVERAGRATARLAMQSSPGLTHPRPASVPPDPLPGASGLVNAAATAPSVAYPAPGPPARSIPSVPVITHPNVNTSAETVGSWTQAGPPRARRSLLAMAVIGGVAVAAGIAAFWALRSAIPDSPLQSTSTVPSGLAAATEGSIPTAAVAEPAVSASPSGATPPVVAPDEGAKRPDAASEPAQTAKPTAGRGQSPAAHGTVKTPAHANPPTGVQLGKEVDSRR
jgi:serine/threonine-protein kinase